MVYDRAIIRGGGKMQSEIKRVNKKAYSFRLNEETNKQLRYLSELIGCSMADIITFAVKMMANPHDERTIKEWQIDFDFYRRREEKR